MKKWSIEDAEAKGGEKECCSLLKRLEKRTAHLSVG